MYIYVLGKCSKNHHTYAWNNYSYKNKNNLLWQHNLMWKSLISPNNMQFYFILHKPPIFHYHTMYVMKPNAKPFKIQP